MNKFHCYQKQAYKLKEKVKTENVRIVKVIVLKNVEFIFYKDMTTYITIATTQTTSLAFRFKEFFLFEQI